MTGDTTPPAAPVPSHGHRRPLTIRVALVRLAVVASIVLAALVVGSANGVGPLARVTPPAEITDPREMLARSLQGVIDASSLHVEIAVTGRVPGALVGSTQPSVNLDGTRASIDARPHDARMHITLKSPPLGLDVEAITLWDAVTYRRAGGPWTSASLGSATDGSGIDVNPLTLVGHLRDWLAAPGAPLPTAVDVACGAPSGRCREVRLAVGSAGDALLRLHPRAGAAAAGPTTTDVVLETDAETLRPTRLTVHVHNADRSLDVTLVAVTSAWDTPSVIPDPPSG